VVTGEREKGGPRRVAVVGLGLMGGSVCRALRALSVPPEVAGFDADPAQADRALSAGVLDRLELTPEALLEDAEVVVYATPLGAAVRLMRAHAPLWGPEALVTDVVSLKAPIAHAAVRGGFDHQFVGAHPVCGGEASGFAAARGNLFDGATIWLCASEAAPEALRGRATSFWSSLRGVPRWTEAQSHDVTMSWVSHLPQLVANALAGALDAAGYRVEDLGPGGRDMTRLAASNPDVWKDLLESSAPVTGTGLTSVSHALGVLADLLARREVEKIAEFMERTRQWRSSAP
jgi:prephenate dehydrogenase